MATQGKYKNVPCVTLLLPPPPITNLSPRGEFSGLYSEGPFKKVILLPFLPVRSKFYEKERDCLPFHVSSYTIVSKSIKTQDVAIYHSWFLIKASNKGLELGVVSGSPHTIFNNYSTSARWIRDG